jgi:hypothetical protein
MVLSRNNLGNRFCSIVCVVCGDGRARGSVGRRSLLTPALPGHAGRASNGKPSWETVCGRDDGIAIESWSRTCIVTQEALQGSFMNGKLEGHSNGTDEQASRQGRDGFTAVGVACSKASHVHAS